MPDPSTFVTCTCSLRFIDPFHICGNAAKLEDKTKEIFASVKQSYCSVLQIGCIPTDVKGVYRSERNDTKVEKWSLLCSISQTDFILHHYIINAIV